MHIQQLEAWGPREAGRLRSLNIRVSPATVGVRGWDGMSHMIQFRALKLLCT